MTYRYLIFSDLLQEFHMLVLKNSWLLKNYCALLKITNLNLTGGIVLTITGFGFASDASVAINSADCAVQSSTPSEIKCTLPGSVTADTYDVEVTQGGNPLTFDGFTYDQALTPEVTSVSPSSVTGQGMISCTLTSFLCDVYIEGLVQNYCNSLYKIR